MKLLSIIGWVIQLLLGTYCLYVLVYGFVNFAIILMFCLYTFAFVQDRIEFYNINKQSRDD